MLGHDPESGLTTLGVEGQTVSVPRLMGEALAASAEDTLARVDAVPAEAAQCA